MKIDRLNAEELKIWVSLSRTLGATKFFNLIQIHGSLNSASQHLHRLDTKKVYSIQSAEKEIESTENIGGKIIPACDPDYPSFLRNISNYPPVITALGNISLLNREIIAIIGGRNSSMNGRNFAHKLAIDLSKSGFITVSGLARGIDTAVNNVIYQDHPTIAVIASGIDVVYPRENLDLYTQIIENGGLVITELPFSTQPKPLYFPQRNRIISGLSLGVVVFESRKRSICCFWFSSRFTLCG